MTDHLNASDNVTEVIEGQSVTLRVIAVLLLIGACWVLSTILVPFAIALMVAIAISPLADRLERGGFPRGLAALTCTLAVAGLIALALGLILFQTGSIVQDSDKYIKGFGTKIDDLVKRTHSQKAATTLGLLNQKKAAAPGAKTPETAPHADASQGTRDEAKGDGESLLRRGLTVGGGWLVTGFGGLLGMLGAGVLFLAYLFYMLEGRGKWVESLTAAARRVGLRPASGTLEKVQDQVVKYFGCLSLIGLGYAVVVSLLLWLLKVPQPILWGLIAGMMEVVPYFGPLIAGILPTVVSLSLGNWWQPVAVMGMFLTLHLFEGYLVEPKLYGKVVRLDPVTILFGAIFFGALWGPGGLAIATPMMIVLRGLIMITPDTPALDALAGVRAEKAGVPEKVGAS